MKKEMVIGIVIIFLIGLFILGFYQKQEVLPAPEICAVDSFDYAGCKTIIAKYEGNKNWAYDDATGKRLYPGEVVIGNPTIGIGHLLTNDLDDKSLFKKIGISDYDKIYSGENNLTSEQVNTLYEYDAKTKLKTCRRVFSYFDEYPGYLQCALLNSVYRGDTGALTTGLLNEGEVLKRQKKYPEAVAKYEEAAVEYLNRQDYRDAKAGIKNPGIAPRMEYNRDQILNYVNFLKTKK